MLPPTLVFNHQVQSKRCGHLLGKQIAPLSEFISRIRAAVAARSKIPGCDIVLIARTDAAQGEGMDEALRRLKAAVEAGADGEALHFFPWSRY